MQRWRGEQKSAENKNLVIQFHRRWTTHGSSWDAVKRKLHRFASAAESKSVSRELSVCLSAVMFSLDDY